MLSTTDRTDRTDRFDKPRERFVRIPEQKFFDLCVDIKADILPNLPAGLRESFYLSILEIEAHYLKKE